MKFLAKVLWTYVSTLITTIFAILLLAYLGSLLG